MSNFLTTGAPITNIQLASKPIVARLPNGNQVQSTHTCTLDLPNLPAEGHLAHIIPGLAPYSLVSEVTLCNAGCKVLFTKNWCTIVQQGRTNLCGSKCMHTRLWMIPLQTSKPPMTHWPLHCPHVHGRQRCSHLHGRQPCAFYTQSVVLATNPNTPPGPRTKLQTHNYPRPHSPPYPPPPTTVHSHQ